MELTKDDCIVMHNALAAIVQPGFADIKDLPEKEDYIFHTKFVYAVSFNKRLLKVVVDALQDASKNSDDYQEYLDERDKILQRYSAKLEDGSPKRDLPGCRMVQ